MGQNLKREEVINVGGVFRKYWEGIRNFLPTM